VAGFAHPSNERWFYFSGRRRAGPFTRKELRTLLVRGVITPATLVWESETAHWRVAGEVTGSMPGCIGRRVALLAAMASALAGVYLATDMLM
jgi:hypothetical protein